MTAPLSATVRVPGSKSITNRALVTAALADGTSLLTNILLADDTRLMIEALRTLGIPVTVDETSRAAEVTGCRGHLPAQEADLSCGNAGTVLRFCTALAALGHGRFNLDGGPRMRQRPIGALVDALRVLGCGVEYHGQEGYPPLTIHARGLRGGEISFPAIESSQFVTALLLVAPYAAGDVFLEVEHDVPSVPYLRMTVDVMERWGVTVLADGLDGSAGRKSLPRFVVETPQRYQRTNFPVEPDASSASYFWAAPAIAGGSVTVRGLGTASIQGDAAFVDVLEAMGCRIDRRPEELTVHGPLSNERLRGVDVDLNTMPDMVPTLAVLALFAEGTTAIRNVGHLRFKETDRLAALATELTKLGAQVTEQPDGLVIRPPRVVLPATIETYDDHRMAMSFALAGLRCAGLVIRNPDCCEKSFPEFFTVFGDLVAGADR